MYNMSTIPDFIPAFKPGKKISIGPNTSTRPGIKVWGKNTKTKVPNTSNCARYENNNKTPYQTPSSGMDIEKSIPLLPVQHWWLTIYNQWLSSRTPSPLPPKPVVSNWLYPLSSSSSSSLVVVSFSPILCHLLPDFSIQCVHHLQQNTKKSPDSRHNISYYYDHKMFRWSVWRPTYYHIE
jgi:hypothetical protein